MQNNKKDILVVLWSSGDKDVAEQSCLMYTHAAKRNNWFNEVILVIWGPSARLIVEDEQVRQKVLEMGKDGVVLRACIACGNMLEVTEELRIIGVDVTAMGMPLTDYLKAGYNVLTY